MNKSKNNKECWSRTNSNVAVDTWVPRDFALYINPKKVAGILLLPPLTLCLVLSLHGAMSSGKSNGASRKRPPPHQPSPATNPSKLQAVATPPSQQSPKPALEDEFMDEDVYLEENLIQEDEEELILRDIEDRQAVASRLSKWARPPLSDGYMSQSKNIGQRLCPPFTEFLRLFGGPCEIWCFWPFFSLVRFQFSSNWRLITWLGRPIGNYCPVVEGLLRSSEFLGSQRKVGAMALIYSNYLFLGCPYLS